MSRFVFSRYYPATRPVKFIALLFCLVVWFTPAPLRAQLSSASVTGVVRDSSGSIVPDVTLSLRNVDTAVVRETRSNTAGNYVFLNIPPGNYSLKRQLRVSRPRKFPS